MDFFGQAQATDKEYVLVRDEPHLRDTRDYVEGIWKVAQPFVDADAPEKAASSYHQAFWEIYLANALLTCGLSLVERKKHPSPKKGPDLLVGHAVGNIWVEAVAPTGGTGKDRVEEAKPGVGRTVPDDQIKLRLLNAIDEKRGKYRGYLDSGIVGPDDVCIIAINTFKVPSAGMETYIPRILRAVLPIGSSVAKLDLRTPRVTGYEELYQDVVQKRSGAEVNTDLFLDPTSAPLSALICAHLNDLNRPDHPPSGLHLVHNPQATNPCPGGLIGAGLESSLSDDLGTVSIRDWNSAQNRP